MSTRKQLEDYTAHLIATLLTLGFFALVMTALLGFVDIKDPATTAFLGTAVGYASAKLDPVLARYFGSAGRLDTDQPPQSNIAVSDAPPSPSKEQS